MLSVQFPVLLVISLHWHFYTPLQVGTKVDVVVTVHLNMGVASGYTHYYIWSLIDFVLIIIDIKNLTDSQP